MTNKDEEMLGPDEFDLANAELREPVTNRRVVVSVSFPRADYERVSAQADHLKVKLSEFVRSAALEKTEPLGPDVTVSWQGGSEGGTYSVDVPISPGTRAPSAEMVEAAD